MTLAELRSTDTAALWASLAPEQQAAIGAAAIRHELCDLVAGDDGTDTTAIDREFAERMMWVPGAALSSAVEAAFPQIEWWSE